MTEQKNSMRAQTFREAVFYVTWNIIDVLTCGWFSFMSIRAMKEHPEWMKIYQLRATKKKK